MTRRRAADDFAAIRARMEELQRERAQASLERSDKSYFYSRRPSPAQIVEQALQPAVARGRFSR